MRLTRACLEKILPTNMRKKPKSSFRRPMQGRYALKKKPFKSWDTSTGQLDEEERDARGWMVPVRERIPEIIVPDLTDCKLKPYVTYKTEKYQETPVTSKQLFDMYYAPKIEAELAGVNLESLPDPDSQPSILTRVKSIFKSEKVKEKT